MTNSAGVVRDGLVLRMSVPASGEMAGLGPELATKLAEQIGVTAADAKKIGRAIDELAAAVRTQAAGEVEFEFRKIDSQLRIVARQGERSADAHVSFKA